MLRDHVMFHGPRVKIGMASGSVMKKVPNAVTGRADYFGPLLNLAARIKSEAAGGQVLVDSGTWKAVEGTGASILGISIGMVLFKGIQEPVQVFQVALEVFPLNTIGYLSFGLTYFWAFYWKAKYLPLRILAYFLV